MRRRFLSLLLAVCLVLGMVPLSAAADAVPSVDVLLSFSYDDKFMESKGSGEPLALLPVTVPYFDLALYGLEEYYFSSASYGDDGDGAPGSALEPGNAESAYGKVTMLHVNIYVTEVYYCGLEPSDAGKGYLKDAGLLVSGNYAGEEDCLLFISGSVGSTFLNRFWDYDCNLNYYINYTYPLASSGWGATSDQILVEDGDVLSVGGFSDWNFLQDSAYGFNYITAETDKVTKGESVELTVMRASESMWNPGNTTHTPVSSYPEVYYCPADDMPGGDVTGWEFLGTADDSGMITLDTSDLAPGTYMIAVPGQYGADYSDIICSAPGGMLLTVEGASEPEPQIILGDLDGSETVDVADVVLLAQHLAEFDVSINETAADINGGGIAVEDLVLLKQYLAEMDIDYSVGQPITE